MRGGKMGWWVYENWRAETGGKARVHNGSCSFCRDGKGFQSQDSGMNGKWHGPFETREIAYAHAKKLRRAKTDFCSRCASII